MRKVNKNFYAPPDALQQGFEERRTNLIERKADHQFDGRIYNNAVKQELKNLRQHANMFVLSYELICRHSGLSERDRVLRQGCRIQ